MISRFYDFRGSVSYKLIGFTFAVLVLLFVANEQSFSRESLRGTDTNSIDSRVQRQITGEGNLLAADTGEHPDCIPFRKGQRGMQRWVKFGILHGGIVFVTAQCKHYPHDDDALSP